MNYDEANKNKDEYEREAVELGHQLIICDALRRDKIIGICESIRGLEKAEAEKLIYPLEIAIPTKGIIKPLSPYWGEWKYESFTDGLNEFNRLINNNREWQKNNPDVRINKYGQVIRKHTPEINSILKWGVRALQIAEYVSNDGQIKETHARVFLENDAVYQGKAYRNLDDWSDKEKGRYIAIARAMHRAGKDMLKDQADWYGFNVRDYIKK